MSKYKFFFAILVSAVLPLLNCSENIQAVDNLPENFKPYFSFENIHSVYSEDAITKIKRNVPKLIRKQNGNEEYPEGIEMELYNEKGMKTTTLRADKGHYIKSKDTYQVSGNVVVTNILQENTLETPLLNWRGSKQEIYTDTTVKITTPNQILHGLGLTATQDFSEYEIKEIVDSDEDSFEEEF